MNIKKEIEEDVTTIIEGLTKGTAKSFEFVGGNDKSIIAVNGFGQGWGKDGLRKLMEEDNLSGKLFYWGLLEKGVNYYIDLLDAEIKKYSNPLLVGFSSGGYIPLLWASRENKWDQICGIVTVATLFHGNPKLSKYMGGVISETIVGSTTLKEVLEIKPPEGKVVSVLPKEDKFGTLPEDKILNWPIIRTNALSHGDVQNHLKWYGSVVKEKLGIN